jgi:hypothetical protein
VPTNGASGCFLIETATSEEVGINFGPCFSPGTKTSMKSTKCLSYWTMVTCSVHDALALHKIFKEVPVKNINLNIPRDERLTYRVDPEGWARLTAIVKKTGMTRSAIARRALYEMLPRFERLKLPGSPKEDEVTTTP